jgi:hypothetical protein
MVQTQIPQIGEDELMPQDEPNTKKVIDDLKSMEIKCRNLESDLEE